MTPNEPTTAVRSLILLLALAVQAACGSGVGKDQPAEPILVTGTAAQPTPSPRPTGSCSMIGVTNVVGQSYSRSVALQAQDASGADVLQVVEPGQKSTPAPNGDRLTLNVNENGTIVGAACG